MTARTPKFAPPEAKMLRDTEAAALLGISRASVWRASARGSFTPVRIGGRTLFRRVDLEAFIERQVQGCEAAR